MLLTRQDCWVTGTWRDEQTFLKHASSSSRQSVVYYSTLSSYHNNRHSEVTRSVAFYSYRPFVRVEKMRWIFKHTGHTHGIHWCRSHKPLRRLSSLQLRFTSYLGFASSFLTWKTNSKIQHSSLTHHHLLSFKNQATILLKYTQRKTSKRTKRQ